MEHLRAGLAAGDETAFAQMYDLCADRLHRYLVVRLGSRADADDVLQETFVRLVRHTRTLKDVSSIAAYVFTVARNEATRFAHRKRREPSAGGVLRADALFAELGSDDLSRRETAELVARALGELPRYASIPATTHATSHQREGMEPCFERSSSGRASSWPA